MFLGEIMKLLDDLKINANNEELYITALTHTSYTNETGSANYERLEYLGDSVLQLVMTEYIYNHFPDMLEGEMSKLRSRYVCERALYKYSLYLRLTDYLLLGHGVEENGGRRRQAIVADVFESFLGALYIDQGLEYVKSFIDKHIIPLIENEKITFFNDYKSTLQELVQTDRRSLEYEIIAEDGPAHNRTYTAEAKIDNIIYGKGKGHSKKEAEQMAAKDALSKSVNNHLE